MNEPHDVGALWKELEVQRQHLHSQRNDIQELRIAQAVQGKIMERHAEEIQRLHREGMDRHQNLSNQMDGFDKKLDRVISTQAQNVGAESARARWVPVAISLLSICIAAIGIVVGVIAVRGG